MLGISYIRIIYKIMPEKKKKKSFFLLLIGLSVFSLNFWVRSFAFFFWGSIERIWKATIEKCLVTCVRIALKLPPATIQLSLLRSLIWATMMGLLFPFSRSLPDIHYLSLPSLFDLLTLPLIHRNIHANESFYERLI